MTRVNRILRSTACAAIWLAATLPAAAGVSIVNVSQASTGDVVVRVTADGATAPNASSYELQLGGGTQVPAAAVAAAAPAGAVPVALVLCLDRSGSMGDAVAAMQKAMREVLVGQDASPTLPFQVGLLPFATQSMPFRLTNDRAQLDAAIAQVTLETGREGRTRLFDAVAGGLAELRGTEATTKRLIVVSDGDDEDSRISQKELIRRASETSIPIDAIGVGQRAASTSGSLATMAGATNGSFQVVDKRDLGAQLAGMIRRAMPPRQYDVTFRYAAAAGGARSEAPVLVYKVAGSAPVSMPLTVSVAAPAGGSGASDGDHDGKGWSFNWRGLLQVVQLVEIERKIAAWPVYVWVGVGVLAVLLVVIVVLWWRSRATDSYVPIPVQPELGPQPLPPTYVPREDDVVAGPTYEPAPLPPLAPPTQPAGRRQTMVRFQWPVPGDSRLVAVLAVVHGDANRRRIDIRAPRTTIGSATDNDAVLERDDFVSGHHALVRAESHGLYWVDLGSTNGSDLNGERFKDATRALSPGDRLTIGRTTLEVMTAEEARPDHPHFEQRVR